MLRGRDRLDNIMSTGSLGEVKQGKTQKERAERFGIFHIFHVLLLPSDVACLGNTCHPEVVDASIVERV